MRRRLAWMRAVLPLATALVAVSVAGPAVAGPPTDRVLKYTEAVIKVLDDPELRKPERRRDRRAAVSKIAAEIFDLEETARRALGLHWASRRPAERQEFVRDFADLLERTYIVRIDQYGGERVRVIEEKVDGDRARVRGQVLTRNGQTVSVEARLHRKGDQWYIYDVAVEGVSLVANYRSQFDRIVRTSSFGELMRRLKNLNDSLDQKEGTPAR